MSFQNVYTPANTESLGTKYQRLDTNFTECLNILDDIISQADAEAGTSTDAKVWTAQRVRQAIDAVFAALTALTVDNLTVNTNAGIQDLDVTTNIDTATITSTGTATVNDLDVTTNVDTATLATTGTASLQDLDVTTNIDTSTLQSTGTATLQDLNVTTNVDAATLATTGNAEFGGQARTTGFTKTFAASATFDLNESNIQQMTLTADVTALEITNELNAGCYVIILIEDGVGGHAIATPGSSFGTATDNSVDFATAANAENIITVIVYPDGTTRYTVETKS